ncbi:unnamed protein product, partial [Choristocarpus tenellus]
GSGGRREQPARKRARTPSLSRPSRSNIDGGKVSVVSLISTLKGDSKQDSKRKLCSSRQLGRHDENLPGHAVGTNCGVENDGHGVGMGVGLGFNAGVVSPDAAIKGGNGFVEKKGRVRSISPPPVANVCPDDGNGDGLWSCDKLVQEEGVKDTVLKESVAVKSKVPTSCEGWNGVATALRATVATTKARVEIKGEDWGDKEQFVAKQSIGVLVSYAAVGRDGKTKGVTVLEGEEDKGVRESGVCGGGVMAKEEPKSGCRDDATESIAVTCTTQEDEVLPNSSSPGL